MAYQEHLNILKQGVEVWEKWRREHIDVLPSLDFSDLSCIDLSDADFSGANLSNTNLCGTTLHNTILSDANLTDANLSGASLRNADLSGANLSRASFCRADLRGADLTDANLSKAILINANLCCAIIGGTVFGSISFHHVKGLEAVHHVAPSTLGVDTIVRSKGSIPDIFLRGCGLPEPFIETLPSLINHALEYYTCFISYSSRDQEFAQRVYADLQTKGVRCWFAPHDMRIGDKIRPRIDESIRIYDKLLLILSKNSVTSQWVEHEVETALGKELEGYPNVLVPIRLDHAVMESTIGWAAHVRRTRHIGDFTHWKNHDAYQVAFQKLSQNLQAKRN